MHAAFEIGDAPALLTGERRRKDDLGATRRTSQETTDRDDLLRAGDRPAREIRVGEVGDRVGAEQHQHLDPARGGGLEDSVRVETSRGREPATPCIGEPIPPGVERHPARQEPGNEPGIDRAVYVPAPQRREEPHVGHVSQDARDPHRDGRRLGERRAAQHDDHRPGTVSPGAADLLQRVGTQLLARQRTSDGGRVLRQPVRNRRQIDERHAELHRRAPHAQVKHRELLFEIGTEQHDRGRAITVGDRGAGHA